MVLFVVGLVIAFYVSVDAHRLGARRGALGGGLLDMGPVRWWFGCLIAPLIFLPCYLVARRRLIAARNNVFNYAPFPTDANSTYVPPS